MWRLRAAHQEITRQWGTGRNRFDPFVSRVVAAEARRGDTKAANRRLKALRGIPRLAGGRRGAKLADALIQDGALPVKAAVDAVHVSIAAVNGIDYLLESASSRECDHSWQDRGGRSESRIRSAGHLHT